MTGSQTPFSEPIPIGEVAKPPFARLPDPSSLFAERAARFNALAAGHDLGPYLLFLADLARIQDAIQAGLPQPAWPADDAIARAVEFGMPPLDRNRFAADPAFAETLARLLERLHGITMTPEAAAAHVRLEAADDATREAMLRNLLSDAVPAASFAEHGLMAAALQVHFARLAASLDAKRLKPVGDGACPACGGPPVASLIVGWGGAHGTRFCACALCGTLWNYVRVKCTLCASTKGIAYHGIAGDAGTIKAETCDSCRAYVKILYQHKDPALEPVADDVSSLGLDLLVREQGFRRGAFNPFLLGY
jgi:FdhE protein